MQRLNYSNKEPLPKFRLVVGSAHGIFRVWNDKSVAFDDNEDTIVIATLQTQKQAQMLSNFLNFVLRLVKHKHELLRG